MATNETKRYSEKAQEMICRSANIDSATSQITVQGARYPEHLERKIDR